jgi:hypothetical protein
MTNSNENRDEVLFAFYQACARPTVDDIFSWTRRFPQFADDIRAHAAVRRDWDACEDLPVQEPDESMIARGYSRTLNALYNAGVAATADTNQAQSFEQMLTARGMGVPQLARDLGIERSVLADLFGGRVTPPIGARLVNALVSALSDTRDAFDGALRLAIGSPHLSHAKATTAPTIIRRTYEETIRQSSMPDERRRYWLEEV